MASIHNVSFYIRLMEEARKAIKEGCFTQWKASITPQLQKRL
ncbi:hypothetical protein [Bacteroides heparinolyticus]